MSLKIECNAKKEKFIQSLSCNHKYKRSISKEKMKLYFEDSAFFEKILSKLKTYFYENRSENEVLNLILNENKKYLGGFIELFFTYFLSDNFPKMIISNKVPEYLKENYAFPLANFSTSLESLEFPKINGKIMIKPNLVSIYPYPETTDRGLIEVILRKLRDRNSENEIIIADGPSLFFSSRMSFDNQLRNIAKKFSAKLIDLNRSTYLKYRFFGKETELYVPKELFDINFLINIANMKERNSAGISGAVKNHFGLIAPFQRLSFHRNGNLIESIKEVYSCLRANLNILDARKVMVCAQQRLYGGVEKLGKGFFYGTDAIELDKHASKILFGDVK